MSKIEYHGCTRGCIKQKRRKWNEHERKCIAEKTENKCCHCSKPLGENWEIEHYIPLATCPEHDELDVFDNLFASHPECNRKGHRSNNLFYVSDMDHRWKYGFNPHDGIGESKLTKVKKLFDSIKIKFKLREVLQHDNNNLLKINYNELKKDKSVKKRIGGYGVIEKYEYQGQDVAVKRIKEHYGIYQLYKEMEANIISNLNDCPYIIRYLGYTILPNFNYGLVMEWVDKDLEMFFESNKDHSKIDVINIILQIADGMIYLHNNNIFHRDIKEQNIMIKDGIIKICDFGSSTHFEKATTDTGTKGYKPPEMRRKEYNAKYADYYVFGKVVESILIDLLHPDCLTKDHGKVLSLVRDKIIDKKPEHRMSIKEFKDEVRKIFGYNIKNLIPKIEGMKISKESKKDDDSSESKGKYNDIKSSNGSPTKKEHNGNQCTSNFYISSPNSKIYHTKKGHYNANIPVDNITDKKKCSRCP